MTIADRVLEVGSSGPEVFKWQRFLRDLGKGHPYTDVVITGTFDLPTKRATMAFQREEEISMDGKVGPVTIAAASLSGFTYGGCPNLSSPTTAPSDVRGRADWPPAPAFGPLTNADRERMFGKIEFVATPHPGNPEAIAIKGTWAHDNITNVVIEQLKAPSVIGAPTGGVVTCHKLMAPKLVELFDEWERLGLLPQVLSWGGAWVPRFVRGSATTLSNHAFGTAIDLNVPWNLLGSQSPLVGEKGSMRELASVAGELGWFWGGYWGLPGTNSHRPDPMHLELVAP